MSEQGKTRCRGLSAGNQFTSNKAAISGGAIFVAYCAGKRPGFPNNTFRGNTATTFPGQIGYNAMKVPAGERPSFSAVPAGAGCLKPSTTGSKFSGRQGAWSSQWYAEWLAAATACRHPAACVSHLGRQQPQF